MPYAATWMDLQIVILSEVSQTEKEKRWGGINWEIGIDIYTHYYIK